MEKGDILVSVSGQGLDIAIYGRKDDNGIWNCSLESNTIDYAENPADPNMTDMGEQRSYTKSGYQYSFEEAFEELDETEWFLCHPGTIHPDFVEFVMTRFNQKMDDYEQQNPAQSGMEQFVRQSRRDEWHSKAGIR